MRHPNPDILLYIGMADAYAAGFEYVKINQHPEIFQMAGRMDRYFRHPTHRDLRPGCYTDDTEMSVANAWVLLENDFPFTREQFADAWVKEFLRGGKRKGYARGFQAFLETCQNGRDFLDRIRGDSNKNGAAMRAVPFGVLPTEHQVMDAATVQGAITHNSPEGLFSARAVALMSHFSLYDPSLSFTEIGDYCMDHLPKEDEKFFKTLVQLWNGGEVKSGKAGSVGLTTTWAVATLLQVGQSLRHIMELVAKWRGDSDSVAAIAWGIASARFQLEELPGFLSRDLENGSPKTGTPYLRGLGERLMDKYRLA